jgi:hypothetical protein
MDNFCFNLIKINMLGKAMSMTRQIAQSKSALVNMTKRGAYQAGNEPYVFINKHTRVICQGMTGKHVSLFVNHVSLGHIPLAASN